MPNVAYPEILKQANWDKKKGIIAKTKPTGIGKSLAAMAKMHATVPWAKIKPDWASNELSIASIGASLDDRQEIYNSTIKPIIGHAKSVATLATKWEVNFTKDKLIPKSAAKAAKDVATAAKDYAEELSEISAKLVDEAAKGKEQMLAKFKMVLEPMLKKNLVKIDTLLKDIADLSSKPNAKNFDKLVLGDGGARGYCTALKNWDQMMSNFPDITDVVFKGKAMDTFFKPLQDYGANLSPSDWESKLDQMAIDKKVVLEDTYEIHAKHLNKQVGDIKKFAGYLKKALELLKK